VSASAVLTAGISILGEWDGSHASRITASSEAVSARSHSNLARVAEHRRTLIGAACSLDAVWRTSAAMISSLFALAFAEGIK
jgi:hypothetical protein